MGFTLPLTVWIRYATEPGAPKSVPAMIKFECSIYNEFLLSDTKLTENIP